MPDSELTPDQERRLAAELFNATWTLIEHPGRTPDDDDRMVHSAHASAYHWRRATGNGPAQWSRGEWQCARVYALLGRAEPALHHARRSLQICQSSGLGDFDLAFAHEAVARALAAAGLLIDAAQAVELARAAAADISDPDDLALLLADLSTIELPDLRSATG